MRPGICLSPFLFALFLLQSLACSQRYDPIDPETWSDDVLDYTASPVDLSFLNHTPAGSHGFVQAVGDHLEFEDGTPVRFWGGNLAAQALFVDDSQIDAQARRMASLGFNLMRIHHHDSTRWVNPSVIDKSQSDSRSLDVTGMDRLDYWIYALKENGIYVWLDLHTGRQFQEGDVDTEHGVIVGYDEIVDDGKEAIGFSYYNDAVRELMKEFNESYLTHVNPYTERTYTNEPAIMGLLLTNENDLTTHYGDKMLATKGNPVHNAIFESRAEAFADVSGLPLSEILKTWQPGPSKIFLNEQEHLFNADLLQHLDSIGVKVPVATTSMWGNSRLYSLPSLTEGTLIDAHAYGGDEALSDNPRYNANYISWIGASQMNGMPLSTTEWNTPYPTIDRFIAPLYVASIASLQGWDAPMIYNYSEMSTFAPTGNVHQWSTFVDPALMGMMPAAALAYREGHIAPANTSYCLDLDRSEAYFQEVTPTTSRAIRTLMEQSQFSVCLPDISELDWDSASDPAADVIRVTDKGRDFIPSGQNYVESDTGELLRDWQAGFQTINTQKTQAASGWIGGRQLDLLDVSFEISTPKATVSLSSLDGYPLDQSRNILISALAQAASPDGDLPILAEPVVGTIRLAADPGLKLFPIASDGSEGAPIQPAYDGGVYTLDLTGATHWYSLKR